ncbi:MAG: tripartite tricarboxylate transporter substrate binding protein [Deltaproteobacteria bacterium]|nr:tripartite tricarboxylate transporter substrate binding protein [Deltaproteobacteria bacterium]
MDGKRNTIRLAAALAALLALPFFRPGETRAESWPVKPIAILVGYAVGGGVDQMARAIGTSLSKSLGQTVIIQNKPGAAGGVAAMTAKSAPADGYTLVVTVSHTYTAQPVTGNTQYSSADFRHIAATAQFQDAFISQSNRPWKDFKGMIAYAKKSGADLKFASLSDVDRLFARRIAKREGVKLTPVPVQGGAAVMPAVLGGHVDFGFSGGALHNPHVQAGSMIVLAGLGDRRLEASPAVPTLEELGYDLAMPTYLVFSAPKGVPQDVLRRLEEGIRAAAKEPGYIELVKTKLSMVPLFLGTAETERKLAEIGKAYRELYDEVGK